MIRPDEPPVYGERVVPAGRWAGWRLDEIPSGDLLQAVVERELPPEVRAAAADHLRDRPAGWRPPRRRWWRWWMRKAGRG